MSGYGTRRNSAQQSSPIAIGVPEFASSGATAAASAAGAAASSPYSASAYSYGQPTAISSSAGKAKRPSVINKTRRLSTSNQLRPASSLLSQSMPAGPLPTLGTRGRSTSISQQGYVDEHGEPFADDHLTTPGTPEGNLASGAAPPHSGGKGPRRDRDRIQTFECEICSKKYRHSTCLIKHRWEHTSHWKEASKLLLSKHQQVQLLEGAAILVAASAGTSLPDEKSFWPAAMSPPASGLLGSLECGINVKSLAHAAASFGSPRWGPSSLMSDAGDFDRSEIDDQDSDLDDDNDSPPPGAGNASHDEDAQMVEDGIFDLDLGGSTELPAASIGPSPRPSPLARLPADFSSPNTSAHRPTLRSTDSGFGSLPRASNLKDKPSSVATLAAAAGVAESGNALGIVGASPAAVPSFGSEQPQTFRGFDISSTR